MSGSPSTTIAGRIGRRPRGTARARREKSFSSRCQYVSPGNLTPTEHLSADLLEYELKTALEAETSLDLVQQVSQSDGLHNDVFEVVDQMPARTVRDYENIIARLRALPAYVDQSIDLHSRAACRGHRAQPAVVVDLMIDQVVAQASASPDAVAVARGVQGFPERDLVPPSRTGCAPTRRTAYSAAVRPELEATRIVPA